MLNAACAVGHGRTSRLLRLALGDVNVTLPTIGDRIKYKSEYETFKLRMTVIVIVLALLNLFAIATRILDALFNIILVWYYSTITLREHILVANGSRIRTWWMLHHYLSIMISVLIVLWPDNAAYALFRQQFHAFSLYLAIVQLLQFRYQMQRLYAMRALGKSDMMETTSEVSQTRDAGLTLLLPCVIFAHVRTARAGAWFRPLRFGCRRRCR